MLLEYGEHHFCFINLKPLTVSPCTETFNSPIDSLAHQCQPPPQKKQKKTKNLGVPYSGQFSRSTQQQNLGI